MSKKVWNTSPHNLFHFTGEETETQLVKVEFGLKAWLVSKAQFFTLCDPRKSWPLRLAPQGSGSQGTRPGYWSAKGYGNS